MPGYYLTFSQPAGDTTIPVGLVLAATLTGKKLFTLQPPRGLSFAGITGAADDRTFVADAHRDPYGVGGSAGRSRTWYLVRIVGGGARASLTMRKLPIPPTPVGTGISAIALSPDGTKLAVATERVTDNPQGAADCCACTRWPPGRCCTPGRRRPASTPRSRAAGSTAGTRPHGRLGRRARPRLQPGHPRKSGGPTLEVKVLNLSRPDGNLLGSSRTAAILPAPTGRASPPRSAATGSGATS